MDKAKNALDFYVLCNRLKTIKRTGWIKWKVRGRKESIGDHVYGAQMLAYAMKYSYPEEFKNINIDRVIMMLSIHELGEIIIGDLTPFQTSAQEKHEREVAAVKEVLSYIGCPPELFDLWLEFENRTTEDAWFAYFCDKCECDIQSKIYDEESRVNLKKLASNEFAQEIAPLFGYNNVEDLTTKMTAVAQYGGILHIFSFLFSYVLLQHSSYTKLGKY